MGSWLIYRLERSERLKGDLRNLGQPIDSSGSKGLRIEVIGWLRSFQPLAWLEVIGWPRSLQSLASLQAIDWPRSHQSLASLELICLSRSFQLLASLEAIDWPRSLQPLASLEVVSWPNFHRKNVFCGEKAEKSIFCRYKMEIRMRIIKKERIPMENIFLSWILGSRDNLKLNIYVCTIKRSKKKLIFKFTW